MTKRGKDARRAMQFAPNVTSQVVLIAVAELGAGSRSAASREVHQPRLGRGARGIVGESGAGRCREHANALESRALELPDLSARSDVIGRRREPKRAVIDHRMRKRVEMRQ